MVTIFLFNFTMFHVKCKLRDSRIAQKCINYHRHSKAVSLLPFENKGEEKSGKVTRLCIFFVLRTLRQLECSTIENVKKNIILTLERLLRRNSNDKIIVLFLLRRAHNIIDVTTWKICLRRIF